MSRKSEPRRQKARACAESLESRTLLSAALVADLNPGPGDSAPMQLFNSNGELYFTANGLNLYQSDGTTAGTRQLAHLNKALNSVVFLNGSVYFAADNTIWRFDGAPGGATVVWTGSTIDQLFVLNGEICFTAGQGSQVFTSDGTAAGTTLVKSTAARTVNSQADTTLFNGALYFFVYPGNSQVQLWRTDGTAAGTVPLHTFASSTPPPGSLTAAAGALYFTATDSTLSGGNELWRTDGTVAGTVLAADINPGPGSSSPTFLTRAGNSLLFVARNSVGPYLFAFDGTVLTNLAPTNFSNGATPQFTPVGPYVLFAAGNGLQSVKIDGTGQLQLPVSTPAYLTLSGNTVYFSASDPSHGDELWQSDGTFLGTSLVADINPGVLSSSPGYLTDVNGTIFFVASTSATGAELWKFTTPLSSPTGVAARALDDSRILLSWAYPGTSATGFKIERSTDGVNFVPVTQLGDPNATAYVDNTGLSASTPYYYRIRATTAGPDGLNSDLARATTQPLIPLAPSALAVAPIPGSLSSIHLAWKDNSGNESSFLIESKSGPNGVYATVAQVGADVTAYDDTGLPPATQFTYRVSAVNAHGISSSNEASAATLAPDSPFGTPIPTPGVIQAEDFDNGSNGFAYVNNTPGNAGGQYRQTDVDIYATADQGGAYYIQGSAGEWLNYTLNSAAATYNLEARVSSVLGGVIFHFEFDGVDRTGPLTIPATGGAQNFRTIVFQGVTLSAGQHKMRLVIDSSPGASVGDFNLFRLLDAATVALPSAPSGLLALPFNGPTVDVTWNNTLDNVSGYRVYRQSAGTGFVQVAFLDASTGIYIDNNVAPLTSYGYQVVAENSAGDGPASQAAVTTLDVPAKVIHPVTNLDGDSSPSGFVRMGSAAYFIAYDVIHGQQLWRTDGTPSGTTPLTTTLTGISNLTPSGSTLYFLASDAGGSTGLWTSDGTPGGTARATGPTANTVLSNLTAYSGKLLYTLSSNSLFITDGTAAGTMNLVQLSVGNAQFQSFTISGKLAYFTAWVPGGSQGLWRTDGTPAGTFSIAAVPFPNSGVPPVNLTDIGGTLYYGAIMPTGFSVYKTDGTAAGIVQLTAPDATIEVSGIVSMGGYIFFTGSTGGMNPNAQVWRSDGTPGGTAVVSATLGHASNLTVIGGKMCFFLQGSAYQLWSSDGTAEGTQKVAAIGTAAPANLRDLNGTAFFTEPTPTGYTSLWRSDGTATGTSQTGLVLNGLPYVTINNSLLLSDYNALTGWEPYISDGSRAGTSLLDDINSQSSSAVPINPNNLTDVNGTLYFAAATSFSSVLWRSDGTNAGTVPVTGSVTSPFDLFSLNGVLQFIAPFGGTEGIWRTDGTDAGTVPVKDTGIALPSAGHAPSIGSVTVTNNAAYFLSTADNTLWKTDGTAAGTGPVMVLPDVGTYQAVALGGELFFTIDIAGNSTRRDTVELWKSDGTSAGTTEVQVFSGILNTSTPQTWLTALNGAVYFRAANTGVLRQLWRSDGTPIGTTAISAIDPTHIVAATNQLFFYGTDINKSVGLWVSDGTLSGTRLVKALTSSDAEMTSLGSEAIFLTGPVSNPTGFWESDGTPAGTVPLQANFSFAHLLTPYNGTLFFLSGNNLNYTHGLPFDGGLITAVVNPTNVTPLVVGSGGQLFVGTQQLMTVHVPAPAPAGLLATDVRSASVTLHWANVAAGANAPIGALVVERTADPTGAFVSILANLTPDATAFTDATASPNTIYYYRVVAVNAGGLSPDAFIQVTTPPLPKLLSTQVNDGSVQRSIVKTYTLTFSHAVTLSAGAITLSRLNSGGSGLNDGSAPTDVSAGLSFSTPDGGLTWVVTFAGSAGADAFGGLADGIYSLTIHSALVSDSLGSPLAGGDQTFTFHRLYGDVTGDGRVNASDAFYFNGAYGSRTGGTNFLAAFDYNNDGRVNAADWFRFTSRFGMAFVY